MLWLPTMSAGNPAAKRQLPFGLQQGKTEVMVSGGITKDGMSKSQVDLRGVCSFRVNANLVLCLQYAKWIYDSCASVKMVSPKF